MYRLQKRYFAILLIGTAISACSFSKDPDKKNDDSNHADSNQEFSYGDSIKIDQFEVTSEPDDSDVRKNFDKYNLVFTWPANKDSRIQITVGEKTFEIDGKEKNSFSAKCTGGEIVHYKIEAWPRLSSVPSASTIDSYQCPKDLYLSDHSIYALKSSIKHLGRVTMHRNVLLNLNGENLTVEIDELRIEGSARIATYSDNAPRLAQNEDGTKQVAPHISLKIHRIENVAGSDRPYLEIDLIGLNGADGRSGDDLALSDENFKRQKSLIKDGGVGTSGNSNCPRANIKGEQPPPCVCTVNPGKGETGSDGIPGLNGEKGNDGMDSPSLNLEIIENPEFVELDILQSPGLGGFGGTGGKAVAPGKGGPGGSRRGCPDGPQGDTGNAMSDGKTGPLGEQGKIGEVTITPKEKIAKSFRSFRNKK